LACDESGCKRLDILSHILGMALEIG